MNKRKIIFIFAIIATITVCLVVVGFMFNKTEEEKLNGLTEIFDIAPDGTIAYVMYDKGQQKIVIKNDENEISTLAIHEEKFINDIAFSPDGSTLAYSISPKDVETELLSTINVIDIATLEETNLFQKAGLITELAFDPKDGDQLFYIKADTFENYSPIARANPHDFDLFSYLISEEKHTQYTNLKKYSMDSLQVSSSVDAVYIQMVDDETAESAEEIFDANSRIFKIPLDDPEALSVVSDPNKEIDIYDFVILSDEEKIIYQSVSNPNSGGIFQYELFEYDPNTNEETQLTNLQEYTSRPLIYDNFIYFIVDTQFAQKYSDYHLYRMDLDGENMTEVELSLDELET